MRGSIGVAACDQWGLINGVRINGGSMRINGVSVIDYCSFCISPICDPLLGPRV
jgi:hypothetical protein